MATPATISITPGTGQLLDAVGLTVGLNSVVRETMVIADPSNATYLATVTSGGALNTADAVLDACITANVLAVSLPTAQITTLTPPTAASIGTAVASDLLIGTQVAGSSVPVALPTATITALTPPTAAAIAAAIVANPPAVTVTGTVGVTQSTTPWIVAGGGTAGSPGTAVLTVQGISGGQAVPVSGTFYQATQPVSIASGQVASGAFASGSIASGAIASGAIAAGAAAAGAFADGSVYVRSNAAATFPVTATIAAAQTIAVTNAGTFAVQAVGTLTNNNAAPSTNNVGVLPAVSSAAAPLLTEGDQVLQSVDRKGRLRAHLGSVPFILQNTSNVSSGSVASLAQAFSTNVSAGTTLVVVCAVGNGTAPTITDTIGNTYTTAIFQPNGSAFGVGIFYASNTTAGANTVTVTPSASVSVAMEIYEVHGLFNVANISTDGQGTIATSTALNSGNLAIRSGESYAFAGFAVGTTAETITVSTVPGNWSNDSGQLNPVTPSGLFSFVSASSVASQLQEYPLAATSVGTISANATIGVSKPHAVCLVIFRQPAQTVSGSVLITGLAGNGNGVFTGEGSVPIGVSSGGSLGVAIYDVIGDAMTHDKVMGLYDVASTSAGPVAAAAMLYNGVTWDRGRTPAIFKTASVPATTSGNTAVWTPTSGKKFRLMRFQITGVNLVATTATVITVSFQDSASGIAPGTYDILLPASSTATGLLAGGVQFNSDWVDLGNGYLSAAANNVLNCNISATVTGATGSFRVNVAGTEE